MRAVLKEPSKRPKEQSWQQMGVMLPILRQNATSNIIRNVQSDIEPEQEDLNIQKIVQNTLHTPAALSTPNILK